MPVLLSILTLLAAQDKVDLSKTKLFVYDSEKGVTLRVKDDGKVELAVKDDKTYSADSVEEFESKYPQVVKKQGLGRYLRPKGAATGGLDRFLPPDLRDFKSPFEEEDFQKLLEDQKKWMDELRRRFNEQLPALPEAPPAPVPQERAPSGKEFGVKIDTVGETLRDQLGLKEGEGVLIGEVKPGSTAEKSGLKQHDIILKLDGKAVGDRWEFRKDVLKALDKPEFEFEILRAGKKETLKAKAGNRKED
jgi:hypothetical protein